MMWNDPTCSTKTLSVETTPLLDHECRHGKRSLTWDPQKGARQHLPNSSTKSQVEGSPSCSRPPFHRRSFFDETLLSPDKAVKEPGERTLLDLQCSLQRQPLLSRSGQLQNWVELRLENSGSVARDHLACERTFLAYMRTSLAIAASGVAIIQLFSATSTSSSHTFRHKLDDYVRPLGASTVVVGLLVLFIGVSRYFTVQAALTKGVFPVARLATGFVAMMLGVLVTLTFGILLAGKLE